MATRRSSRNTSGLTTVVNQHVQALVSDLQDIIRTEIANELQAYFGGVSRGSTTSARGRGRRKGKNIRPCIAPGCKNPSKGPRFHYLCEKHVDAPKKDWEAWQAAQRDKASPAAS